MTRFFLTLSRHFVLLLALAVLWPSLASAQVSDGVEVTATHVITHMDKVPRFCANPTIISARNGDWSNPATWSTGRVPAENDKVAIAEGTTVTYSSMAQARITCVEVAGTFTFSTTQSTRLMVRELMVLPQGTLLIGTEDSPVASTTAEIVIINRPLDTGTVASPGSDPQQYGNGLFGYGTVMMHGAVKSPTWLRLGREVQAEDTTLTLEAPVPGWRVGDRLVLPDTRQLRQADLTAGFNNMQKVKEAQWEELTVASIAGTTVTLTSPVRFAHRGGATPDGTVEFMPHVGNLSRTITIRSEDPAGFRGHTMFLNRAEVDIRYVLFKDMGRTKKDRLNSTAFDPVTKQITAIGTNQIGRYSLHMHHLAGPVTPPASGYQFQLIGNAIDGDPKWALTVHNTHFGLVKDNVVYNAGSGGIVTEDGSETGNVIDHNFVVRSEGTTDLMGRFDPQGRRGTNFWLRGGNNIVHNNVAADGNFGFAWFIGETTEDPGDPVPGGNTLGRLVHYPKGPGLAPTPTGIQGGTGVPICLPADNCISYWVGDTQILEFRDNEAYSHVESGMGIWGWIPFAHNLDYPHSYTVHNRIQNSIIWHEGQAGVEVDYSIPVILDGLLMRGDTRGGELSGIGISNHQPFRFTVRNADIQGMAIGYGDDYRFPHAPSRGVAANELIFEGGFMRNALNFFATNRQATWFRFLQDKLIRVHGTRFAPLPGQPLKVIESDYVGTEASYLQHSMHQEHWHFYNYNGVAGDHFQYFYPEQHPDAPAPAGDLTFGACPEDGLTNQQCWDRYRVAILKAVAPCTDTRAGFDGPACSITDQPRLVFLTPTRGATWTGEIGEVMIGRTGNLTGVSQTFRVQLDDQPEIDVKNYWERYWWEALRTSPGKRTIRGYLLDANGQKIEGSEDELHLTVGPVMKIMAPIEGATVEGDAVTVRYYAGGESTNVGTPQNPILGNDPPHPADHVHLRLDTGAEIRDLDNDGTYVFTGLSPGQHTITGFLARADHSKLSVIDTVVTFTVADPSATGPEISVPQEHYAVRQGERLTFPITVTGSSALQLQILNLASFPGAELIMRALGLSPAALEAEPAPLDKPEPKPGTKPDISSATKPLDKSEDTATPSDVPVSSPSPAASPSPSETPTPTPTPTPSATATSTPTSGE